MLRTNIEFLDRLIRRTSEQFYMSEKYWRGLRDDLEILRHDWRRIRHDWERARNTGKCPKIGLKAIIKI